MNNDHRTLAQRGVLFQGLLLLLSIIGLYFLRNSMLRTVAYSFFGVSILCNVGLYIKLFISRTDSTSLKINTCLTLLGNITICFFIYNNRAILYQYAHPLIVKSGFCSIALTTILESVYLARFTLKSMTIRKCLLAVCILFTGIAFVLINLPIFQMWIRWDSYAYLFDFYKLSPEGIFSSDGMHVAQHLTTAYGLLAIGLQSVFNLDMRIVLCLLNIAFMFGTTLLFYLLFRTYTPKASPFISLLYAVAFGLSPHVFGLTSSFCLETIMLFSLLLLIYADATENEFLLLLGGFMLCNSKETGVVITCGIMFARIVRDLVVYRKSLRHTPESLSRTERSKCRTLYAHIKALNVSVCISVILVGILWLVEFSGGSWTSTNNEAMYTVDGSVFNSFGVSFIYISSKIETLLFANFNWLIFALIIVAFITIALRRQKCDLSNCFIPASAILFGCIFFFTFITYNHFRYWSPIFGPLYVICYILLQQMFFSKKLHAFTAVSLGCLFCIQCFTTIDPVMLAMHGTIDTGLTKIVSAEDTVIGREDAVFVDSACYNHQIMFFDEALDLLLEEVEFNKDTTAIVVTNGLNCPTIGGSIGSLHMLTGFGYQYMDVPRYVAWNPITNRRELTQDPSNEICIAYYSPTNDPTLVDRLQAAYNNVFYIELPWYGREDVADITSRYGAEQVAEVIHKGWKLRAYKF